MQNTAGEVRTNLQVTYSSGTNHMDKQRQDDRLEPKFNSSVPIQDVDLPEMMDDIEGWPERVRYIRADGVTWWWWWSWWWSWCVCVCDFIDYYMFFYELQKYIFFTSGIHSFDLNKYLIKELFFFSLLLKYKTKWRSPLVWLVNHRVVNLHLFWNFLFHFKNNFYFTHQ